MDFVTLVGIALGLAMDAFAVSIASGVAIKYLKIRHALRIAFSFGMFQAVMPIIGWLSGSGLRDIISNVDHWITFGLLTLIGCKMMYESNRLESKKKNRDPLNLYVLFLLSIATSMDALAVGITFAFLRISILTPVAVIGGITFLLSFAGVFVGGRFGHFFEKKIEIVGGLILIGMGIKILVEHLT